MTGLRSHSHGAAKHKLTLRWSRVKHSVFFPCTSRPLACGAPVSLCLACRPSYRAWSFPSFKSAKCHFLKEAFFKRLYLRKDLKPNKTNTNPCHCHSLSTFPILFFFIAVILYISFSLPLAVASGTAGTLSCALFTVFSALPSDEWMKEYSQ